MKRIRLGSRTVDVPVTITDRLVGWLDPVRGARRLRARTMDALSGSYVGASRSRRATKEWLTRSAEPDADILYDLPLLRERSRDLIRNAPLAVGAINTSLSNVVGSGLTLQSRIDAEYLGMSEEEADAWQDLAEREWRLFSESQECDLSRTLNFKALQSLAYRQTMENGDVFVLTPRIERSGSPYRLKLQIVEADRICNQGRGPDTERLVAGIEKDPETGAPMAYHILNRHPGAVKVQRSEGYSWQVVPAFGARTGLRNVLHLYDVLRPGQTRGVPYLAPVIESLKQLDRYTEAELMAAVVAGMFTVFITTDSGDAYFDNLSGLGTETGATSTDDDVKLGTGAVVGLKKNESITTANPTRPNSAFDPFVKAILQQIGAALGIPFEVLIRHFSSSYSASRAALLEAWRFFRTRRLWLAANFCQPVYEIWLYEAVALGRIPAPGYFYDPALRKAYNNAVWIGDSPGYVDPQKDVEAARERVDARFSTLDEETALLTGGDFEANLRQMSKERRMLSAAGLLTEETPRKKTGRAGDAEEET